MKILIDTHIFYWAVYQSDRLNEKRKALLTSPGSTIYVSSISLAELTIKKSIGKIELDEDTSQAVEELRFEHLNFDAASAMQLMNLPFHHKDPFDRMLIAQSMSQKLSIMSDDSKFADYACKLV